MGGLLLLDFSNSTSPGYLVSQLNMTSTKDICLIAGFPAKLKRTTY